MKAQYIKIDDKGNKYYYSDKKMSKLHRVDGPAVDNASYEGWYINGKLHREYGPALNYKNDTCFWFVNGKEVTKQEHHAYFNPPKLKTININGKVFTVEQLNDLIETAKGNKV